MATWHMRGKAGIFPSHLRRWCPARIDALVRNPGDARPAALFARYCDRIADGLAAPMNEIKALIAEADNDLSGLMAWVK